MRITFEVPGKPKGKQRPRIGKWGAYTPKQTVEYEKYIRECFNEMNDGKWFKCDCAIMVEIKAYFKEPKKNAGEYAMTRTDCDNIAKIILDALNDVAYNDDKQVVGLVVEKFWGTPDKVVITLQQLD